jgi:hypothetical protein
MAIEEVNGIPIVEMWKYRGPLLPGETVYPIPLIEIPEYSNCYGYTKYGRIIQLAQVGRISLENNIKAQRWAGTKTKRLQTDITGLSFQIARLGCWALYGAYCFEPNLEAGHFPDRNPANNAEWNILPVTKSTNYGEHRRLQGTAFLGELHKDHKLTVEQVLDIRRDYIPYDPIYGQKGLAKKYGVCQRVVGDIVHNVTWTHIKLAEDKSDNNVRKNYIGKRTAGTIWINNGVVSRRIKLSEPIPEGWWRGQLRFY